MFTRSLPFSQSAQGTDTVYDRKSYDITESNYGHMSELLFRAEIARNRVPVTDRGVLESWLINSRVPNARVVDALCREHGSWRDAVQEVEVSIQVIEDGLGCDGDERLLPYMRDLLAYMRG